MEISLATGLDWLSRLSVITLLGLIIYGGSRADKAWWVFGWIYRAERERRERAEEDRDEWRQLALSSTRVAEGGTRIAEQAVQVPARRGRP